VKLYEYFVSGARIKGSFNVLMGRCTARLSTAL
jgi:hypothetical protein